MSAACLGLSWHCAVAARVRASARARLDAECILRRSWRRCCDRRVASEALGFAAGVIVAEIRIGGAEHAAAEAVFERE